MELSTFLLIFLGIAGSALSRSIHSSQSQQQQSVDEATSRDSSSTSMVDYLADSIKDAQAYRREVVRELELLNRVSTAIREHPSSERQLLVADLIDRLSWSYGHLDQYIDLFVPDEKDLTNELLSASSSSENTSSNDGDVDAAKLSKRAWPKRMYNTKYSNIPVIRTGK